MFIEFAFDNAGAGHAAWLARGWGGLAHKKGKGKPRKGAGCKKIEPDISQQPPKGCMGENLVEIVQGLHKPAHVGAFEAGGQINRQVNIRYGCLAALLPVLHKQRHLDALDAGAVYGQRNSRLFHLHINKRNERGPCRHQETSLPPGAGVKVPCFTPLQETSFCASFPTRTHSPLSTRTSRQLS